MALEKSFFIKVFEKQTTVFKKTLPDTLFQNKPNFTTRINDGASPIELIAIDTFYDFINNQSELSEVDVGDRMVIYVQDKDSTTPQPIFSGVYGGYGFSRAKGEEELIIQVLPNTFYLSKRILKSGDDLEVGYDNYDLSTILKEILNAGQLSSGIAFQGGEFSRASSYEIGTVDVGTNTQTFSICAVASNLDRYTENFWLWSMNVTEGAGTALMGLYYDPATTTTTVLIYDDGTATVDTACTHVEDLGGTDIHYFTVTSDGTTVTLYIDGVSVDTGTATGNWIFRGITAGSIGGIGLGGSYGNPAPITPDWGGGDLYDSRVYSRTLDSDDIDAYARFALVDETDLSLWYKCNEPTGTRKVYNYGSSASCNLQLDDTSGIIQAGAPSVGNIGYTEDTIDDPEVNRTYDFKNITTLEALRTITNLSPDDWFFRVGADDLVYYKNYNDTTLHRFKYDLLEGFNLGKDITSIVNSIYFLGGGDPALFKHYEESASYKTYGLFEELQIDERVTSTTTAETMADGKLTNFAIPKTIGGCVVMDNNYTDKGGYDIESLNVGDRVSIDTDMIDDSYSYWGSFIWGEDYWNFREGAVFGVNFVIASIQYDYDRVILELDFDPDTTTKRIEDINRDLRAYRAESSPSAPTV